MLKFLRKYQTIVLAVGVSLLMVAFLLNDVMLQISHIFGGQTTGTIVVNGSNEDIDSKEFESAAIDYRVLSKLNEVFEEFFPSRGMTVMDVLIDPRPLGPEDPNRISVQGAWHWALLKREASEAGLMGGRLDANVFSAELAAMFVARRAPIEQAAQEVDVRLQRLAGVANVSLTHVQDALASYVGVRRLVTLYQEAGVYSDGRLQHIAADFGHAANVTALFLDAGAMLASASEPAEDAIAAQFEKYRDTAPGTGQYGFGYRQPDRVKVEYLTVDYDSILAKIDVSGVDARKWYLENKNNQEFIRTVGTPPAPVPYEQVSVEIISRLKNERAQSLAGEISKFIKSEILPESQGLERDGDYRKVEADWSARAISLEALRERVQNQFGVDVNYRAHNDKWLSIADLNDPAVVGDIASAVRDFGSQSVRFSELATSVRELGHPRQGSTLQVGLTETEPVYVKKTIYSFNRPLPPNTDMFFYRITAADNERPAASLDEVREQIVRDLKRFEVYTNLVAQQETWKQKAIDEGIDKVGDPYGLKPRSRMIARYDARMLQMGQGIQASEVPGVGRYQALSDAIMTRAYSFDPRGLFSEVPKPDRFVVMPIEDRLGLAVVEITANNPMSRENWQSYSTDSAFDAIFQHQELGADLALPFKWETMRSRFQLKTEGPGALEEDQPRRSTAEQ